MATVDLDDTRQVQHHVLLGVELLGQLGQHLALETAVGHLVGLAVAANGAKQGLDIDGQSQLELLVERPCGHEEAETAEMAGEICTFLTR